MSKVDFSSLVARSSFDSGLTKASASPDIVADKILENLLHFYVPELQPGASNDWGHASSEQRELKILTL